MIKSIDEYSCESLRDTHSLLLIFAIFVLTLRALILIISCLTLFLFLIICILVFLAAFFIRSLRLCARIELRLVKLLRKVHHQELLSKVDLTLQIERATSIRQILLIQYLKSLKTWMDTHSSVKLDHDSHA